jgi:hypothetical protein
MAIYISDAHLLSLEQPREVFTSRLKMSFDLLKYALTATLFGSLLYARNGSMVWPSVAAVLLAVLSIGVFKYWKYHAHPILVLSKDGLRIFNSKGEPLVPWSNLSENVWLERKYAFIATSAWIELRDTQRPKPYIVNAKWLDIKGDEYLRLCDLYATAARSKQDEHA